MTNSDNLYLVRLSDIDCEEALRRIKGRICLMNTMSESEFSGLKNFQDEYKTSHCPIILNKEAGCKSEN